MSTQHTPGPWAFVAEGTAYAINTHDSEGHVDAYIADTIGGLGPDVDLANARLIAAAPDLLYALEFVMSAHGEQLSTAFEYAQRAIAKAEGR